jgi:ABC-type phosphate transport system substrate-binding protein
VNKNQKLIVSMLVLAMLALSATSTIVHGALNGSLVSSSTLTIKGSSTVYPIANEEAGVWQGYWNGLVAANPSWGASTVTAPVALEGLGSGTAIPALTAGTADIGEMSRPPNNASGEWLAPSMSSMQIWAVGIDSVAIVVSPDMQSWFPHNLNTLQVGQIFALNPTTGNPAYVTWNDFFTAQGISTTGIPQAALSESIGRAVRDPTSGTFDCFNNYFAKPNGMDFQHKDASGNADASKNMAGYTYCQENLDVYNKVSVGDTSQGTDYIGFISLGYYQTYGNMFGLNIAFNIANPPASTISVVTPVTWGPFVTPNRSNVIYAFSGVQGSSATGKYYAWRYLWEVTPSTIPSTGPLLETGVWISYMKATNTTNSGAGDFVSDQSYIELNRADFSGAVVLDGALAQHGMGQGLAAGQTQSIPDGKCNFKDISYFVSGYIAYYSQHIYNPYVDMNSDGKCNFNDIKAFVTTYVAYYTSYNP